jgi:putative DNA primase/helicase
MSAPAHLQRLLARLDGVKRTGKASEQYSAKCPSHDDRHASLSVKCGGNKHADAVVVHCHAGCPTADVLAAIDLTTADLFQDQTRRGVQVERRHMYCDPQGTVLYAVERVVVAGRRTWLCVHPDQQTGRWATKRGDADRVLYRLPQLLASPDLLVWITEGERDADTLGGLRMLATTVASGKWSDVDLSPLRGRRVRIAVDNDSAGWKRGIAAMTATQRAGAIFEGCYRPNDGCKDVTCHYAEGTAGELIPVDLVTEKPPCETWGGPEPLAQPRSPFAPTGRAWYVRTPVQLFQRLVETGQLDEDAPRKDDARRPRPRMGLATRPLRRSTTKT